MANSRHATYASLTPALPLAQDMGCAPGEQPDLLLRPNEEVRESILTIALQTEANWPPDVEILGKLPTKLNISIQIDMVLEYFVVPPIRKSSFAVIFPGEKEFNHLVFRGIWRPQISLTWHLDPVESASHPTP